MKCDLCDKPAVVHEVVVKDGIKREIHLCEQHAEKKGYNIPGHTPINEMLTQFVISKSSKSGPVATRACPTCGMSYAKFRQSGILGCPDCYEMFEKHLNGLIERAQNGATHHVGKSPRSAGGALERQRLIQRLVRELDDAVDAEQYERAASLRDQLRSLESDASSDATSMDAVDKSAPETE